MCLCAKLLQWCPTLWEWTVAHHALLSMGFSRQEYWSGLPCPPSGDLFDPGIKPALNLHLLCPLHWQVGSLPLTTSGKPNYSLLNTISVLHTFFFCHIMWHVDLNSWTRNRTQTFCIGRQSFNHRSTRDVWHCVFWYTDLIYFLQPSITVRGMLKLSFT